MYQKPWFDRPSGDTPPAKRIKPDPVIRAPLKDNTVENLGPVGGTKDLFDAFRIWGADHNGLLDKYAGLVRRIDQLQARYDTLEGRHNDLCMLLDEMSVECVDKTTKGRELRIF